MLFSCADTEAARNATGILCGMTYSLTWEPPNGACRRFTGLVSSHELIYALEELTAARQFDDLRYSISIFTDVTGLETDRSTLEDMAALDYGAYEWNPRFVSVIVAEDALVVQLLRSFGELNVSRIPRRFFNDEGDARAWIDLILTGNRPEVV